MEKNLSKFDLFDSMMNRLDVNPSLLTLDWLQQCALSFVCIPSKNSRDGSVQGIVGKGLSLRQQSERKTEDVLDAATSTLEELLPSVPETETPAAEEQPSREFLFYEEDWKQLDEKFELNNRTRSQVRCGMFAYMHGSKVVITQKTLSSQKMRNQNYVFAGIVFDLQEDQLLTLQFCAYRSSHAKALKRMFPENRFPSAEECERMFIYQEILNQAFQKMNIDFQKTEKIFYTEPSCATGKIGLFNFANGKSSASAIKTATADVYQVQTIKLN